MCALGPSLFRIWISKVTCGISIGLSFCKQIAMGFPTKSLVLTLPVLPAWPALDLEISICFSLHSFLPPRPPSLFHNKQFCFLCTFFLKMCVCVCVCVCVCACVCVHVQQFLLASDWLLYWVSLSFSVDFISLFLIICSLRFFRFSFTGCMSFFGFFFVFCFPPLPIALSSIPLRTQGFLEKTKRISWHFISGKCAI